MVPDEAHAGSRPTEDLRTEEARRRHAASEQQPLGNTGTHAASWAAYQGGWSERDWRSHSSHWRPSRRWEYENTDGDVRLGKVKKDLPHTRYTQLVTLLFDQKDKVNTVRSRIKQGNPYFYEQGVIRRCRETDLYPGERYYARGGLWRHRRRVFRTDDGSGFVREGPGVTAC